MLAKGPREIVLNWEFSPVLDTFSPTVKLSRHYCRHRTSGMGVSGMKIIKWVPCHLPDRFISRRTRPLNVMMILLWTNSIMLACILIRAILLPYAHVFITSEMEPFIVCLGWPIDSLAIISPNGYRLIDMYIPKGQRYTMFKHNNRIIIIIIISFQWSQQQAIQV